jgi:hypothetical protein
MGIDATLVSAEASNWKQSGRASSLLPPWPIVGPKRLAIEGLVKYADVHVDTSTNLLDWTSLSDFTLDENGEGEIDVPSTNQFQYFRTKARWPNDPEDPAWGDLTRPRMMPWAGF